MGCQGGFYELKSGLIKNIDINVMRSHSKRDRCELEKYSIHDLCHYFINKLCIRVIVFCSSGCCIGADRWTHIYYARELAARYGV